MIRKILLCLGKEEWDK